VSIALAGVQRPPIRRATVLHFGKKLYARSKADSPTSHSAVDHRRRASVDKGGVLVRVKSSYRETAGLRGTRHLHVADTVVSGLCLVLEPGLPDINLSASAHC
jgi:hypothetical protein